MRSFQSVVALMLGVLAPGELDASGTGFSLFRNYWGDVVVATSMTPEGKALPPPTPEKPVYYLGRSLAEKLGTITGDKLPDTKDMTALVVQILAKQGYIGARPGVNDPALYLILQWGYITPRSEDLLWFLGYDPRRDIAAPVSPVNLGPEVWRRNFRSREIETILGNASEPIYGIIVTAFEYKSAKTPDPVVYWQTRIGLPANGKSMAQALPAMIRAAGTAIGRESDSPLLRDADAAREGYINLGELKILEVDGAALPALKDSDGKK